MARQRHFRNPDEPGAAMFITTTCLDFAHLFQRPEMKESMSAILFEIHQRLCGTLHAFVVMPHHLHFVSTMPADSGAPRFVQRIKTESSYPLLPSLEPFEKSQLEAQAGLNRRRFWMRSFRGIRLKTDRSFWQTIRYVHANPVKAGLVDDAENYRWSSASMFLKQWWHPEDGLIVPDDYWDQTLLNRDKRRR